MQVAEVLSDLTSLQVSVGTTFTALLTTTTNRHPSRTQRQRSPWSLPGQMRRTQLKEKL